jgi:hypothetical protein
MALGSTQPGTRYLPGGKGRPVRKADREATEANPEKIKTNPEMMQSAGEHREFPKEGVDVKCSGTPNKQHRGRKLTAGPCGKPKELTRGDCGSRRKLVAGPCGKPKELTLGDRGSRRKLAATCRKL